MADINMNKVCTETQDADGSDSSSDLVVNSPSTSHPTWPTIPTPDFNVIPTLSTLEPTCFPLVPTCPDQESSWDETSIKNCINEKIDEFFVGNSDEHQMKELKSNLKDYDQQGVMEGHIFMIMKKSFRSYNFAVVLIMYGLMNVLKPDKTSTQVSKLEDINEDGVYMVIEYKNGCGHATTYFKRGELRDRFDPQEFQKSFTCVFHCIHYLKQRCNGHCHDTIMEKYTSDKYENDKMVFNHFKQNIPLADLKIFNGSDL